MKRWLRPDSYVLFFGLVAIIVAIAMFMEWMGWN